MTTSNDLEAVEHFKEYLRIPSVHPDVEYTECVTWLRGRAAALSLSISVEEVTSGRPVVVITWPGRRPELPTLLLTSHMDVVPVFDEYWTHPPFSAHQDSDGNIYARGTQDMKCVGVQYLEAVHRLAEEQFRPDRTVHICFTPDEEIGCQGMKLFVKTDFFKHMNVGCALDEGIASPDEGFLLFYGERNIFTQYVTCSGTPGHGSILLKNTAGEKLAVVVEKFMERRAAEEKKLRDNPILTMGDVTTINLTKIEGGVQGNVVPPQFKLTFDCRLSLDTDVDEFDQWVREVCKTAGKGVQVERDRQERSEPTRLDSDNPWWTALRTVFSREGLAMTHCICPGTGDAQQVRALGIPAFGFSPINNTPVLMHDHNEFLNEKVFLKGIDIYAKIIVALCSVSD